VQEVIGQNPRILKSGETSSGEYRQLWKAITGGKEWRGTFHNRRKDGKLYWERASISPVFDADGKIANFMAVKEDITEFMEADAERQRVAAGFHAVFAALPSAVMLIDGPGRILLANPAAETMLGTGLPQGARFDSLNLRWMDADGVALTGAEHPVTRILAGSSNDDGITVRMGIVPPTGGVRWLTTIVRPVALPETHEVAALLVFAEAG
jgi:PAS domain-containing protein